MTPHHHSNHPGELTTDRGAAEKFRTKTEMDARARAVEKLLDARVPFLVGGAYAYCTYTGIYRDTKDLDLFPRRADALRALEVLAQDGWRTERTDEGWLYKAFKGVYYVDLIFSSGNRVAEVDDEWFIHAKVGETFGYPTLISPAEELIWSKAFVLERERFDGADVIHLIKCVGPRLDWARLLRRFDRHWEVLFSHVLLFRFAYPGERTAVPDWVMAHLTDRLTRSVEEGNWAAKLCRGTLLSRVNYTVDIREWGYADGREWDLAAKAREVKRDDPGAGVEAPGGSGR